ncbi:tetratricopeptide repeat protein [Nocardia sp. CC201C]|uniref:tetratricopeptide repeat protein n=1 Tax=Nocardia sp. CC201C TaxID=3044575 RepID=UPI0024A96D31|nr:tetratricopeptide repeat protein [Nocardia sp. CC201C]
MNEYADFMSCMKSGRFDEAIPLCEQTLIDRERALGPDHPHTLSSRNNLAGAAHHEHVLEIVYWDAGTARLLPRLIKGRTRGPVFVTHRRPGPPVGEGISSYGSVFHPAEHAALARILIGGHPAACHIAAGTPGEPVWTTTPSNDRPCSMPMPPQVRADQRWVRDLLLCHGMWLRWDRDQ